MPGHGYRLAHVVAGTERHASALRVPVGDCRPDDDSQMRPFPGQAPQAAILGPGPAGLTIALTTGPGRNWASLWKPLIDAFGPVLGEDPARPFHPHDDRIVSLALHHNIDTGIAHDVIIDAWWTHL